MVVTGKIIADENGIDDNDDDDDDDDDVLLMI